MNAFGHWLQHKWTRTSAWQFLLRPISWLFRLLSGLRRVAFARHWLQTTRLAVPVIVVGNITIGGSGKTPLVIWLVEQLCAAGYAPGVISRGYGGTERGPFEVGPLSDASEVGDEPVLIAGRSEVPLFIGRDRVAAGEALLAAHPNCDVIISDDGLQHYRLQREIEIVVVDEVVGFGNGCLLPAGPLREDIARLKSVDAVVINRATTPVPLADSMGMPVDALSMRLLGQVFQNLKDPHRHALAADLRESSIHAVAGIGRPERFFDHLRALRLNIVEHAFPDHHRFQAHDLAFDPNTMVLMTEKDAVKCKAFAQENWWSLAVTAELDDRLMPQILKKLRPTYGPQTA
jgi:tetraacyldisaccharide 4'-kinase